MCPRPEVPTIRRFPSSLLLLLLVPLALGAGSANADYRAAIDLTFPVDGPNTFRDDYDACRSGCSRYHRATDLMTPYGTPVHAAVGGTIRYITGLDGALPSWGWMITIAGDDGRDYSYIHLGRNDGPASEAYAPGMRQGLRVSRGELIGFAGCSGNASCTAPHLHFEIEDRAVTDPYGTNQRNPFASLRAALERNDLPGRPWQTFAGRWSVGASARPGWFRDGLVVLDLGGGRSHSYRYGSRGDVAVVGDWDGDGVDSFGVVRGNRWLLRNSHDTGVAHVDHRYGPSRGAVPVVGDWNDDGLDTAGVVVGNTWYLANDFNVTRADVTMTYGPSRGALPVTGRWHGGGDLPGVVVGNVFHLAGELGASRASDAPAFGSARDLPLVGDWDGDGRDTPAVLKGQTMYLRNDLAGGNATASTRVVRSW